MHLTPFPNLARKFIIKHSYFISMTDQIYNNFILSGVSNNKIFKIPNGIEFIQISKSVVTGRFNCLFIGNLYQQPAKGIDVLFLAWKELLLQIPNAKLTIIGDGNIDAYENYLKKLGINESVTLAGRVNPVAHFNSHDLFILPSRREGMSNALMEAMMYGLPVVATNVSGSKDLIQHGINGYLVEVDDKNGLVEAINMALMNNELRVYCSKFNPERIKNLCDMNIVSNKYMHAYDNILQLQ